MRGYPALRIACPALRQIKLPVDEGMAIAGHISREHANLAVGDLARRAGILTGNTAGRLALLQKASLVNDEHGIGRTQRLDNIVAHDIAKRVRVPDRPAEHRLLAPGSRVTCRFGTHPASLAPLGTKQAIDVRSGRLRNTGMLEQRLHPSLALAQYRRPQVEHCLYRRHHMPTPTSTGRSDRSPRAQL